MGIVKKYDPYDHKWYYYIGTGLPGSFSEAADIQYILDWGQKYSSLDFISAFQELRRTLNELQFVKNRMDGLHMEPHKWMRPRVPILLCQAHHTEIFPQY